MTSLFSSSDNITKNQLIVTFTDQVALSDIWNNLQRERCVQWIQKNNYKRIALQFPDNVLRHSIRIVKELRTTSSNDIHFFVLGDTSYGSCCVDEVAASHASADGIIHFGHACLSKATRVPILYVFFQYTVVQEQLLAELERVFTNPNTQFVCFYEVCFADAISQMTDTLVHRFPSLIIASLVAPDQEADRLCWKCDTKLVSDCPAIYIGRDNLSFFNTAVAFEASQWFLYDPTRPSTPQLERKDAIETQWLRRRYYAIERCKDASSIGIVVGTLSARGYLEIVSRIQRLAKAHGVRTYIISVGKVNPEKLANFCDIDCFVLVGCPENDIFTSRDFFKPLLSVFEAEMALNPVWRERMGVKYTINYADFLSDGRHYSDTEEVSMLISHENDTPDVSLITGNARGISLRMNHRSLKNDEGDCRDVVLRSKNELANISSSDHFANRSWQGLEPNLGQDKPAVIQDGRSGIPMKYENDPNST